MADQTGHTPGPWKYYWREDENYKGQADCGVYSEVRKGHAYSVCRAPRHQSKEQWEADARLIAAAPDLLAALKVSRAFLLRLGASVEGATIEAIDAAIAKAEG